MRGFLLLLFLASLTGCAAMMLKPDP
ncbi:MAG: hypothetical protein CVV17_12360, partial [Gammaproteobacteria bacterium HGW-Gammaproteobacteria-7]